MSNIKAVLYYEFIGLKKAVSGFWIILGVMMILSILLSFSMSDGVVYMSGTSLALALYMIVTGFITVKVSLPYCIRRGATRNQFLAGIGLSFFLTSMVMAAIHTIFLELGTFAGNLLNVKKIHFFRASDLISETPSIFASTVIDMFLFFFCLAAAFFIGAIFFRFARKAGYTFLAISPLFFLPNIQEKLIELTRSLVNGPEFANFFIIFIIGIVCFAATWPVIRNLSIHPSS
ncbi:hypothetical protein [Domibacillus epiphyticus]|nr:hypothetical protein [Domibacillus epiphyticus]